MNNVFCITNRIGIIGEMRAEQGLDVLGRVLRLVTSIGFGVLLQDSRGKMKIDPRDGVKTIGFLERFSDAFDDCDAVLLNYSSEAYRFMGSGVMWEALANATPVIYTRGTALAPLARKYCAGIPFTYGSMDSLASALRQFKGEQAFMADRARETAASVRAVHSVADHVAHLC